MPKISLILVLSATLLLLAGAAGAQTPAPPPSSLPAAAPASPVEVQLRERLAHVEEALKARQDEAKRLQDEQAKLRDRLDGVKERQDTFWTPFGPGLAVVGGMGAVVAGILVWLFGFYFPRIREAIIERGREGLISASLEELAKDARLVELMEAHRDEIARVVLARDARIVIEGDDDARKELRNLLSRSGYRRFIDKAEHADVLVLIGKETCERRAREILAAGSPSRPVPVVLYTGPEFMDKQVLADLNEVTLVVPATTRGTVVAEVGTLAALTARLAVSGKTT